MQDYKNIPDYFLVPRLADFADSELKNEVISDFENIKNLYKKPDFDETGLRWPTDLLATAANFIVKLPLEFLSEFVDAVTKTHVDKQDTHFFTNNVDFSFDNPQFNMYGPTTCGNLAYIILHLQSKQITDQCYRLLIDYAKYRQVHKPFKPLPPHVN